MEFKLVNPTVGDLVKHPKYGEGIVIGKAENSSQLVIYYYDTGWKQMVSPSKLEFVENKHSWYNAGKEILRDIARAIDSIGDSDLRRFIDLKVTALHRIGLHTKYADLEQDEALYRARLGFED